MIKFDNAKIIIGEREEKKYDDMWTSGVTYYSGLTTTMTTPSIAYTTTPTRRIYTDREVNEDRLMERLQNSKRRRILEMMHKL